MFRAFPYALKACELGSVESCINVSVMYKKGEGVKQVSSLVLLNNKFQLFYNYFFVVKCCQNGFFKPQFW